jgi:hypothetical protein
MTETQIARELKKCRHFRGVHKTCAAGCQYPKPVVGVCFPKFKEYPDDKPSTPCPKFAPYTREEIEEHERDIAAMFNQANVATKAILEATNGKRGVGGVINPCPCCKTGQLHFSVAGCNGHIHAKCTTPDCVNFMQ